MNTAKKLIGILGGTFDPVHLGHIYIAEQVLAQTPIQQLQFMPCFTPPHRQQPKARISTRLAMLKLAIVQQSAFSINTIEIQRGGISYSIDTLIELNRAATENSFALIIGLDVLAQLNKWHRWQEILNYCHLIVISRAGFKLPTESWLQNLLSQHQVQSADDLLQWQFGKILLMELATPDISASQIRQSFLENKYPGGLLAEDVERYIKDNGVY